MFQSSPSDAGRDGDALHRRVAELEAAFATQHEHLCRANAELEASRTALAESEDRFRAVLESATDYAIITTDLAGRITGWNAGAQRVFGWTEAEVLRQDAALIWTPQDSAAGVPEAEMRTALEAGQAAGERWHARRDGTLFWAAGQLTPLRNGGLRGYLRILRDHTAQRLADERLRESEEQLRLIVEGARDYAIFTLDGQGRVTSWNTGAQRILGWAGAEILGRDAAVLYTPEDVATGEPGAEIEAALVRDQVEGERWMLRRDGARFWAAQTMTRLCDEGGVGRGFLKILRDRTGQRLAEEALGRSEARLAWLLATAPAAIVETDATGAVAYANPAAERIAGGPLIGRRLDDPAWEPTALDGTPFQLANALVVRVGRGETVTGRKQLARMPDGRRMALSASAVPVRAVPDALHPEGRVTGALVVFTDITAQHEAGAALLRLNETLEAEVAERTKERDRTWRLSQDVLAVGGLDAVLVAVNPAWTATLGWTERELVGRSFLDLVHPDDREATLAEVGRLAGGASKGRVLNRYQQRDGAWRWLAWTAVADAGLIYATGRDVTAETEQAAALRVAEEALRQAQKMEAVGQLTGGLAHDFNNMLQGVGTSLELLQRRLGQGRAEEAVRHAEAARKGVDRAAALTQRLLAFARRQQLQPRSVDPDALVRSMAELIERTVGPEVQVALRLRDGTWPVLCDPNGLESALLNLAVNARDAMAQPPPEGSKAQSGLTREARAGSGSAVLTIGTRHVRLSEADLAGQDGAAPGDYVEVAVTDTGTGMDEATRARAFEPFFTTKPVGLGTGLGLSQLYGFVRQSGGAVCLDSAPGQGTTVRLYLPRHGQAAADEAQQTAAAGRDGTGAAGIVLLVEDEVMVRELAAEHLRELGYGVLEAGNGPAALRLLARAGPVDLLVTDVGLPGGLNGRQVADAARGHRPDLPVLFITGYAGTALDSQLAPGMAVAGKPFTLDALATRVAAMLDGGRPAGRDAAQTRKDGVSRRRRVEGGNT